MCAHCRAMVGLVRARAGAARVDAAAAVARIAEPCDRKERREKFILVTFVLFGRWVIAFAKKELARAIENEGFYEFALRLWESQEQDLNYNAMISQRGIMKSSHMDFS